MVKQIFTLNRRKTQSGKASFAYSLSCQFEVMSSCHNLLLQRRGIAVVTMVSLKFSRYFKETLFKWI